MTKIFGSVIKSVTIGALVLSGGLSIIRNRQLLIEYDKGLKAAYPELVVTEERALTPEEKRDITALLDLPVPADEAKERVKNNLCSYVTASFHYGHGRDVYKKDYGTCFFIRENLVVSAYHVLNKGYKNIIFHSYTVIKDRNYIPAADVVAISLRHDLALVRLRESDNFFTNNYPIAQLPIGKATANGGPYSYHALRENLRPSEYNGSILRYYDEYEGKLEFKEEQTKTLLNREGRLEYHSLLMDGSSQPDDNGAPVLDANGKVIGLLVGVTNDKEGSNEQTGVTPHLYDFLSCVVNQPQCTGWEK